MDQLRTCIKICFSSFNPLKRKTRYGCFCWFSKLTLYILSWLRVGRFIDRFSPIQKYAYHDIPCSRAILSSRFIFLSLYSSDRVRLSRARSLHTREMRCYHVCPNNSAYTFDSSMFLTGGEKRSPGLRYLLIAVTSAPNCTPKPESLPSLSLSRTFPLISLSFLPPCLNHVDLDLVSPLVVSCIPRITVTSPISWPLRTK